MNWFHQKENETNNDEFDENSEVETCEERLKRLRTKEIDAQIEAQTPRRKQVGGRENTGNLERGVELIEERMQRLRTSRMDTRLRTPAPRRKGGVRVGKEDN